MQVQSRDRVQLSKLGRTTSRKSLGGTRECAERIRWSAAKSMLGALDVRHLPPRDVYQDQRKQVNARLNRAGSSNGDVPMLHFTQHTDKPTLRLLVLHDEDEREFAYTIGHALKQAAGDGWTAVSGKHDWATVS